MPPVRVPKVDVPEAYQRAYHADTTACLNRLERHQPDLLEFMLDTLSVLHAEMEQTRLSRAQIRRLTRRIELLGVVLVDAVCLAHQRQQPPPPLVIPPLA